MADIKYLTIDNVRVRYTDKNQKGFPLVLIHGLGGSIESWINNIEFLSTKFRVIALDLPGFGLSDKPRVSYTIKYYVNFLEKFINKLKINHLYLIGSSLGGHIGVEFTLRNRKMVDKLILISPAGCMPKSFKGTITLKRYIKIVKAKSANDVFKILSSIDKTMVSHSYANVLYKRLSLPGSKYAFISALKGSAKSPRYESKLTRINTNMLLLWGKEDNMIPLKYVRPFIEQGNSRIIILENCGHRPHAEKAKLFNKIVKDFLTE
ncbi:MAG TPA: alpha/beta hydrolase [Nitrososphaeraceae archaeon]|nr:alpha/beta hydrolase [Nitrososphaeraceae archaeon]